MAAGTRLETHIRAAGFKLTPPRRAVLSVFGKDEHLSPEEIFRRARKSHPRLGRATVYRTLELLTDLGIMRPIYLHGGRPVFTRIEGGHHHLVCSRCDKITELAGDGLAETIKRLAKRNHFEIRSQLLEVYGVCAKCRKRK